MVDRLTGLVIMAPERKSDCMKLFKNISTPIASDIAFLSVILIPRLIIETLITEWFSVLLWKNTAVHIDALPGNGTVFWR